MPSMVPAVARMHLANARRRREPVRIGWNGCRRRRSAGGSTPSWEQRPVTGGNRSLSIHDSPVTVSRWPVASPGPLSQAPENLPLPEGAQSFAGGGALRPGGASSVSGNNGGRRLRRCAEAPARRTLKGNRSQTVVLGADRRRPVGGPAVWAALSSPVGPSPSKSLEPWLVLSPPDRLSRTLSVAWAQRPVESVVTAVSAVVRGRTGRRGRSGSLPHCSQHRAPGSPRLPPATGPAPGRLCGVGGDGPAGSGCRAPGAPGPAQ